MSEKQYTISLLDMVKHFAVRKVLKTNCFGRWIYPVVQKFYRSFAVPMKRRRLQRHGVDCMRRLHEFFTSNEIGYYCDSGTLLGFVRDHGFINGDDDIDVAIEEGSITPVELLKKFVAAGYGFVHAFNYEGKIIMFTVADYTQITIDVYFQTTKADNPKMLDAWCVYWRQGKEYPSPTANDVVSYPFLKPDGFKLLDVLGIKVRIPANEMAVLDTEYYSWQKPVPNFTRDQYVHTDWPGYGYRLTLDEALAMK